MTTLGRTLPVAVAVLSMMGPACGRLAQQAGGDAGIDHPTGAKELVLRVSTGGGFVPEGADLRQVPEFSLLGDGTVVTQGPQIEIYPGPALPNLMARTIDEPGIQAILDAARTAGLLGPNLHIDYPFIADAPTTTFTLIAEGRRHEVSVYALGFEDGVGIDPGQQAGPSLPPDVTEARRVLADFRNKLFDLERWLPGAVGAERFFEFEELRIHVMPATRPTDPALTQEPVAWPLAGSLEEFGVPVAGSPDTRCGTITGPDLDRLVPLLERANELTPWTSGTSVYILFFRPLLPDESGCSKV